jgi:hypothetical protein
MDRFFNHQNLERLRNLASATTEAERKILLGLLAEEEVRLIELHSAKTARLEATRNGILATSGGAVTIRDRHRE